RGRYQLRWIPTTDDLTGKPAVRDILTVPSVSRLFWDSPQRTRIAMDRRRFFTAAGAAAALAGIGAESARADDRAATPHARFDAATVKAMRDRIRPIGADEYHARQEHARRLMKDNKIDAIFVEGGTSLEYFTGLKWWLSERLFAMVMPQKGDA